LNKENEISDERLNEVRFTNLKELIDEINERLEKLESNFNCFQHQQIQLNNINRDKLEELEKDQVNADKLLSEEIEDDAIRFHKIHVKLEELESFRVASLNQIGLLKGTIRKQTPHKCPICNGTTFSDDGMDCKVCDGNGIVCG
jgi:hypothetical protein